MLAKLKDLEIEAWYRLRESGELKWRTKDGLVIPIKDMSDEHLYRCIKMIKDNLAERENYLDALGSVDDNNFYD